MEAALIIPVLLMLIFGMIDFGRMLNAQIKVTEAAREGARLSSLGASTTTIESRVYDVMGGSGGVGVSRPAVCGSNPDPAATATVNVTYEFSFVTPFAALAGIVGASFDLTSTGAMPCHG